MSVPAPMVYESYEMRNIETSVALYRTTATLSEIQEANQRLKETGNSNRFFHEGTFHAPLLHDPCTFTPGNDSPGPYCAPEIAPPIR